MLWPGNVSVALSVCTWRSCDDHVTSCDLPMVVSCHLSGPRGLWLLLHQPRERQITPPTLHFRRSEKKRERVRKREMGRRWRRRIEGESREKSKKEKRRDK